MVHLTHLQRLRAARDEQLSAAAADAAFVAEHGFDDDELPQSPGTVQVQRRCGFLESHLKALLQHTHDVERLLDAVPYDSGGTRRSPDATRRLSIQKVAKEGLAMFNDLQDRLYTVEVQKANIEQELARTLRRCREHEQRLRGLGQERDMSKVQINAPSISEESSTTAGDELSRTSSRGHVQPKSPTSLASGFFFPASSTVLQDSPYAPLKKAVKNVQNLQKAVRLLEPRSLAGPCASGKVDPFEKCKSLAGLQGHQLDDPRKSRRQSRQEEGCRTN